MLPNVAVARYATSLLATNALIRNTYILLSLTLLFSAMTCAASMAIGVGRGAGLITSLMALGLLWFVLPRTANSGAGIGVVFVITGLLGFGLGPMLNAYLALAHGSQIVLTALGERGLFFWGSPPTRLPRGETSTSWVGFCLWACWWCSVHHY